MTSPASHNTSQAFSLCKNLPVADKFSYSQQQARLAASRTPDKYHTHHKCQILAVHMRPGQDALDVILRTIDTIIVPIPERRPSMLVTLRREKIRTPPHSRCHRRESCLKDPGSVSSAYPTSK